MSHLSPIKSLFILTYKKGSLKHLKIWTYTVWSATFLLKLFMFNQTVRFCCKYGGYPVVSFRFAITTHNVWFLVVRSQAQSKFLSSKTKIFYHHRNYVQNSNDLCRNRLLAFFLQKIQLVPGQDEISPFPSPFPRSGFALLPNVAFLDQGVLFAGEFFAVSWAAKPPTCREWCDTEAQVAEHSW